MQIKKPLSLLFLLLMIIALIVLFPYLKSYLPESLNAPTGQEENASSVTQISPEPAKQYQDGVFNPYVETLSNGLKIIVVENHMAPIVSHKLIYNVGSTDEDQGKTGLAHFLEHLMFKGTKSRSLEAFESVVYEMGGNRNASTSLDKTTYFMNANKDYLPKIMELEADRMVNLAFDEQAFNSEKKVILEEWNYRIGDSPDMQLYHEIIPLLFKGNSYSRPIIGYREDIKALTAQDAYDFYQKWYAPNNAILIVTGDVKPDEVMTLARRYYESIPVKQVPDKLRSPVEPLLADSQFVFKHSLITHPNIDILYLAPTDKADPRMAMSLTLLSKIFEDEFFDFKSELVSSQKLLLDFSTQYDDVRREASFFGFSLRPSDTKDVSNIQPAFQNILFQISKKGISQNQLDKARHQLKTDAIFARDSLMSAGYILADALISGMQIEDVEQWAQNLDTITIEEVNKALTDTFIKAKSVTSYSLPAETQK